jgi:radical SAM family protein
MAAKKLRIGILDIVTRSPKPTLYGRIMNGNLASIMPQAIGVWCEEAGHEVSFICYTGGENLATDFPDDLDILFIAAFTQSAQLSYAISNLFRKRGVVTVLGGPHARCYPEDAQAYFDYVLGLTDRDVITDVLADCAPHQPEGRLISALKQPQELPGAQARWKYISSTLAKTATNFKMLPMIASLGCPYTCSFCIDSVIKYQPLDFGLIREDLKFILTKFRRPIVGWHDPNFGVKFDEILSVIDEADPERRMRFVAESSLSLLSEERCRRLASAGFEAVLPGIESWYDMGAKSKTGAKRARDKMLQISDHINMIMRHLPYVQTNFVLGLDCDEGPEPFELTKEFLDRTPGAFPAYSLFSAFGQAAPLNLDLQKSGRVLRSPFHFLNNNQAMNVKPLNYSWPEFYDRLIDLTKHSFTWKAIARRASATPGWTAKWMNVVRAVSSEGFGRIKYNTMLRERLDTDKQLRAFFERDTEEIPEFYTDRIKEELGPFWEHLPKGGIEHDQNAYMKKANAAAVAAQ